jgi:hypothetical protein
MTGADLVAVNLLIFIPWTMSLMIKRSASRLAACLWMFIAGLLIPSLSFGSAIAGQDWASAPSAADNHWSSVTYGNGLFVAVSSFATGNQVMTSPNGITWTSRTSAANNDWRAVTYGNGLFVAVANSGTGNRVMTSPDGITWTSRTPAVDNDWTAVTYGNGLFVAVSSSGTGNRVMVSPPSLQRLIL